MTLTVSHWRNAIRIYGLAQVRSCYGAGVTYAVSASLGLGLLGLLSSEVAAEDGEKRDELLAAGIAGQGFGERVGGHGGGDHLRLSQFQRIDEVRQEVRQPVGDRTECFG